MRAQQCDVYFIRTRAREPVLYVPLYVRVCECVCFARLARYFFLFFFLHPVLFSYFSYTVRQTGQTPSESARERPRGIIIVCVATSPRSGISDPPTHCCGVVVRDGRCTGEWGGCRGYTTRTLLFCKSHVVAVFGACRIRTLQVTDDNHAFHSDTAKT